jgi:hypothetical protein
VPEDFTYTAEQQIEELIKSYKKLQGAKKECVIFSLVVIIGMFIFFVSEILNQDKYTYIFILLGAIFNVVIVSGYLNIYNKRFEQHKENMMKLISEELCKHDGKCSCKDEFAKYLYEKEHINLVL